jgi:UDP-N-acetylglucosamine 1-carboxyvinyltransferase
MSQANRTWRVGTANRLLGPVRIHGNKNAALPAIAAALLLPDGGSLHLDNVPRISDVATLCDIIAIYGVTSLWTGPSSLLLRRTGRYQNAPELPETLASRIRGSIVLLGALAAQYDSFRLAKPGGDRIGGRPITAHIAALEDLGFQVTDEGPSLQVRRQVRRRGGTVLLIEQSVTATLMLLLYSACLKPDEHLTILNAACEPHVITLCLLLESMGATVDGLASNLLTVRWPHGTREPAQPVRLDDDFMEAATFAVAAAVTRSDLDIPFANAGLYLNLLDRYLGWMGVRSELGPHQWRILGSVSDYRIHPALRVIKAEPWPRFPTDVMSMFIVLATRCTGSLKFVEYMYDDRFGFVQSLRDIGAHIDVTPPHAIVVHGPTALRGDEFFLRPDIRSGAAMLLAALAADGTTVLHDRGGVIERGYQDLPRALAALGAPVEELVLPLS